MMVNNRGEGSPPDVLTTARADRKLQPLRTPDGFIDFFRTNANVFTPNRPLAKRGSNAIYCQSDTRAFSFANKYENFTKEKAFMLYYNNRKSLQIFEDLDVFNRAFLIGNSARDTRGPIYDRILANFRTPDPDEDYSIAYTSTLYPKEFYAYNRNVVLRPKFIFNDWRQTRSERTAPSDYQNSQFVNDANIKFSVWPLDAQPNFGKQREMELGKDKVGSFSEGELMSTIGLYRSGSNNPYSISGSAMYSRRSPETTIEHSFEFTDPSKFDTLFNTRDALPYFGVIRDQDIEERYLLTVKDNQNPHDGTGVNDLVGFSLNNFELPFRIVNLGIRDNVDNLSDYVASANNTHAVNFNRVFNGTIGGKILRCSSSPQEGTIDITDIERAVSYTHLTLPTKA